MNIVLKTKEDVEQFFSGDGATLIGTAPDMAGSQIVVTEKAQQGGCVLCCGEGVVLTSTKLTFAGPGAVVFIAGGNSGLRLDATVHGGCTFAIGSDTYTNGPLHLK